MALSLIFSYGQCFGLVNMSLYRARDVSLQTDGTPDFELELKIYCSKKFRVLVLHQCSKHFQIFYLLVIQDCIYKWEIMPLLNNCKNIQKSQNS